MADEALKVDFGWMQRQGLAVVGHCRQGSLKWTCRGEPSGNISYLCDMRDPDDRFLELRFTVTVRSTGEKTDYVQRIGISSTRPNFGGHRWWLHCPITGERVGKLYCPAGHATFGSRKALGLGYHSQRIAERDKPFEALFRLQKRLGCPEGWEQPIRRPKGMWRRTYARWERRYWELDRECAISMAGVMARFR